MRLGSRDARAALPACSLLVACGGAPAPVEVATPTSAPPAASAAPITGPAPAADAGALATPATPAPVESPFHVAVEADHSLDLHAMPGALIVSGGPIFARIENGRVAADETFLKGIESWLLGVTSVAGRWPDDPWLTFVNTDGRTGWGSLHRFEHGRWNRVGGELPHTWLYAGVAPWSDGRMLALSVWTMPFQRGTTAKLKVVAGRATKTLPEQAPGNEEIGCHTRVYPAAFTALTSGEVFVYGRTCDTDELAIEWWASGATRSTIETFGPAKGGGDLEQDLFSVGSSSDVWLAAAATPPLLAHFDGKGWKKVDAPQGAQLVSIAARPEGTLWAIGWQPATKQSDVWRRAADGAWTKLPLPETAGTDKPGSGPSTIAFLGDEAWIAAGSRLLTTRPTSEPQKLKWEFGTQFAATSVRMPKAATPGCESLFALMYGLTKMAPPDFDFPLTRKALKGHTEFSTARFVETEEGGRRYFGAFVPDYAAGKKLVGLIQKKVKGSIPQLLCHQPVVKREIAIDLATGEIRR